MLFLLRRAESRDGRAAAALILEAAPSLELILGDRRTALRAAHAAFRAERTELSHRFAMVEEGEGTRGLVVAFPGRLFGSLKLGTGVTMARSAGTRHLREMARRGRILDRLIPHPGRETLYVSVLAVAPHWRKRGVGAVLMERLLTSADWMGRSVALDTALDNEGALRLYERLGFRTSSVRKISDADRRLMPIPGMARLERPATGRSAGS